MCPVIKTLCDNVKELKPTTLKMMITKQYALWSIMFNLCFIQSSFIMIKPFKKGLRNLFFITFLIWAFLIDYS